MQRQGNDARRNYVIARLRRGERLAIREAAARARAVSALLLEMWELNEQGKLTIHMIYHEYRDRLAALLPSESAKTEARP
jgi:hypothetical protein